MMKTKIVLLTAAALTISATAVVAAPKKPMLRYQSVGVVAKVAAGSSTPSFNLSLDASVDSSNKGNIADLLWRTPKPLTQTITPGTPYQNSNVFGMYNGGSDYAKGNLVVNYTVTIGDKQFTDKETIAVDIANNTFGNIDVVLPPQNGIVCEFIANSVQSLPNGVVSPKIQVECTN